MTRRLICAAFAVLTLAIVQPAASQTAYQHPNTSQALESRFDWAHAEANETGDSAYWIAYSVRRMMREDSWMGQYRDGWTDQPTLASVLTGAEDNRAASESLKDTARRALNGINRERSELMVEREVAVLSLYRDSGQKMEDVDLSNMELTFDFESHPVYWLGVASDRESIPHLIEIYSNEESADLKEDLVSAVGMHEEFSLVRPFIVDVIESRAHSDVREGAVFWLYRDETTETLRYLTRIVEADRSEDVRENAVFTLSRMSMDSAVDRLIQLARLSDDEDVRETARFWLGQKASKVLLGEVDDNDEESKIQKQAVFALAQIDDDGGVEELISLVHNHSNPVVRKQALFWLGQSESDQALDTIIAVLRPGS